MHLGIQAVHLGIQAEHSGLELGHLGIQVVCLVRNSKMRLGIQVVHLVIQVCCAHSEIANRVLLLRLMILASAP